ncbi:MAG: protein-tyrosine phosphatase family protein [Thermoguttaceae bacterium]
MKQKLPFKFSYKVTDNFYAGEYPFEPLLKDGLPKLKSLTDFGVSFIIDLTSEHLTPYDEHLPESCFRFSYLTIDYTCPDFEKLKEIHEIIEDAADMQQKIYVHCKGGHDRTGVVVATYFVHAGLSPKEAKKKFYKVFVPPVRVRYPPGSTHQKSFECFCSEVGIESRLVHRRWNRTLALYLI